MINFLVKRCFPISFIQGTPRLRAGNQRKDNNVFNQLSLYEHKGLLEHFCWSTNKNKLSKAYGELTVVGASQKIFET